MKSLKITLAGLALCSASAFAAGAPTYSLDPAHTNIGFGVRHIGISVVRGNFRTFTGTINYDPKKPEATKIKVDIDANSLDTSNAKRDGHVKSKDFLDTAKFSKITFVSKSAKMEGKEKMLVTGDLTIHGVTKPVTLTVEDINGPAKNPLDKKDHIGGSATATINRQDFGITWNGGGVTGAAGEAAVANDVKLQLDIDAVRE